MIDIRRVIVVLTLVGLGACLKPPDEPDCLADGRCECTVTSQCPTGRWCVDGRCINPPDAGRLRVLGEPCEKDSQCEASICLPRGPGNGGVCSRPCARDGGAEACDRGWECKSLGRARVCVPPYRSLCLACSSDQNCNAAGDLCLALDGGSFCGQECNGESCPSGSSCRTVSRTDGGTSKQCVPNGDTCACTPATVGLKRACKSTNAVATCFGDQTCRIDGGFSDCDARAASAEVCDGVDNDCDGLTDSADDSLDVSAFPEAPICHQGACSGRLLCGRLPDAGVDAGVSFYCSGAQPEAERCNGKDDDCDGTVDEDFIDSLGRYVAPTACGSCANDCTQSVKGLRQSPDGGAASGSVACELKAGGPTCVPRACAPGFFLSPPGAPQTCEPAISRQCQPCTVDGDCHVASDRCVAVANDPGLFCAQACGADAPYPGCTGAVGERGCCPIGHTCRQVNNQPLCVPNADTCQCAAVSDGLVRACLKTAGLSVCVGSQTCRADAGFDVCDATATSAELCDGLDNDCSGQADEPFLNTRGTGTYDSDEHCGDCTTNCIARYSPKVQHAIGACFPRSSNPKPGCAIRTCTTETVPLGASCRADSDCSGMTGGTCDGVLGTCQKTCVVAGDCALGETCVQGRCGTACSTSTACQAKFGPSASCGDAGMCGTTAVFHDVDHEDTNGCECAEVAGVVDEPDTSPRWPTAGLRYVDRNCDGVDGTSATALFVSASASAGGDGSRSRPFQTIREAMGALGGGATTTILVAQGSYFEQVVLKNGASMYGGYSGDFTKRDVVLYPTLIEAPEPASGSPLGSLNAENLTTRTVVAGFVVRGYDVVSRPAVGAAPANSIAVYARNAPALELRNNHLVGGRGGDALPATSGAAGAGGLPGANGQPAKECNSPNCTSETQGGGSGGLNTACNMASGTAGAGADPNRNPQSFTSPLGLNGAGGSNSTYQHSAPSQAMYCKYDCVVPATGTGGQPAKNGSDGTRGAGGLGCATASGSIFAFDWRAGGGFGGTSGLPGVGGGGGGAGGCVNNAINAMTCSKGRAVGDLGATGGGGGAAGCGGTGGSAGVGGGSSFAIFVIGAAPVVEGNLIDVGFGGRGGAGGAGGYGGAGAKGGAGGGASVDAWCAGIGGPGGRGGNGGAGGGGGGGCGGSAWGIAGTLIPTSIYGPANTFAPLPLNAAGPGGAGGASPGGGSASGTAGVNGVAEPMRSL